MRIHTASLLALVLATLSFCSAKSDTEDERIEAGGIEAVAPEVTILSDSKNADLLNAFETQLKMIAELNETLSQPPELAEQSAEGKSLLETAPLALAANLDRLEVDTSRVVTQMNELNILATLMAFTQQDITPEIRQATLNLVTLFIAQRNEKLQDITSHVNKNIAEINAVEAQALQDALMRAKNTRDLLMTACTGQGEGVLDCSNETTSIMQSWLLKAPGLTAGLEEKVSSSKVAVFNALESLESAKRVLETKEAALTSFFRNDKDIDEQEKLEFNNLAGEYQNSLKNYWSALGAWVQAHIHEMRVRLDMALPVANLSARAHVIQEQQQPVATPEFA